MSNLIQLKWKDLPVLRKKLLKKQKGLCALCNKIPKIPCLDHHHTKRIHGTGLVRKVLCSGCNIFLAKSENNCIRYGISQEDLPVILRRMANYLEAPQTFYIHPSEKLKPKKLKVACLNELKKAYSKKYPKRKALNLPKSRILTKKLKSLFKELQIKIEYVKK